MSLSSLACRALVRCASPSSWRGPGCSGEDLPRQPVSGFVTLDGRPLASGVIIFYPDHEDNDFASVNGGSHDQGWLLLDSPLVRTRSRPLPRRDQSRRDSDRRRESEKSPRTTPAVAKEVVPAKYNSETDLTIEIKDTAIKEVTFHLDSH